MTTNGVLLAGAVDELVANGLQPGQRQHRLARSGALRGHHPPRRPGARARGPRGLRAPRVAAADQGQRGRAARGERARRPAARRDRPPPPLRRAVHRGDAARRAARVDPRGRPLGRRAAGDDRRALAAAADGARARLGHRHALALRRRSGRAAVRLVGHRALLRDAATACASRPTASCAPACSPSGRPTCAARCAPGRPTRSSLAIATGAVARKEAGHGMADPTWTYTGRPMSMIGG